MSEKVIGKRYIIPAGAQISRRARKDTRSGSRYWEYFVTTKGVSYSEEECSTVAADIDGIKKYYFQIPDPEWDLIEVSEKWVVVAEAKCDHDWEWEQSESWSEMYFQVCKKCGFRRMGAVESNR